jgi:hypothetical protein
MATGNSLALYAIAACFAQSRIHRTIECWPTDRNGAHRRRCGFADFGAAASFEEERGPKMANPRRKIGIRLSDRDQRSILDLPSN